MPLLLLLGNRTAAELPPDTPPDPVPSDYSTGVEADNPLTWYRMDAPSGTTEIDRGSLGLNGTYVGSPTLGASGVDVNDAAVLFASSNHQYLDGQDHDGYSIATTGSLSVEWWAKFDVQVPTGHAERMVGKAKLPAGLNAYEWLGERHQDGVHLFQLFSGGDPLIPISQPEFGSPSLGSYHHYVATMQNVAGTVTVKVYLDGALADTDTVALASIGGNAAGHLQVGAAAGDVSFTANGIIDEVAVYSTALSAQRILAHYQAIFPPAPEEPEAVPSLATGGIALEVIRVPHPASVLGTGENPDLLLNGPEAV